MIGGVTLIGLSRISCNVQTNIFRWSDRSNLILFSYWITWNSSKLSFTDIEINLFFLNVFYKAMRNILKHSCLAWIQKTFWGSESLNKLKNGIQSWISHTKFQNSAYFQWNIRFIQATLKFPKKLPTFRRFSWGIWSENNSRNT